MLTILLLLPSLLLLACVLVYRIPAASVHSSVGVSAVAGVLVSSISAAGVTTVVGVILLQRPCCFWHICSCCWCSFAGIPAVAGTFAGVPPVTGLPAIAGVLTVVLASLLVTQLCF